MIQDETGKKYIEIAGEKHHETPNAILWFDGIKKVWIPKSQIEDEQKDYILIPDNFTSSFGIGTGGLMRLSK